MRRARLIIMLKEPVAGRVKTRLGAEIGMTQAAWWFRHQTRQLIRRLSIDSRWETLLAVAPDTARRSRFWPAHLRKIPQGRGDLGNRMCNLLRDAPAGPALIIGGDIPGVERVHIERAFSALGKHDMVFGPATDGGFWLVGAKRGAAPLPNNLFNNVRWSTEHALKDTLKTTGTTRVALTTTLQDVDTASDLRHH